MFPRTKQGTVDVVAVETALTRETIDRLSETVSQCLAHAPPRAVLDLQQTPLMDSAGLELLLDLQDQFEQRGGCIKLAAPGALCRDILHVTGVDSRFEMFGNVKSAIGSFVQ